MRYTFTPLHRLYVCIICNDLKSLSREDQVFEFSSIVSADEKAVRHAHRPVVGGDNVWVSIRLAPEVQLFASEFTECAPEYIRVVGAKMVRASVEIVSSLIRGPHRCRASPYVPRFRIQCSLAACPNTKLSVSPANSDTVADLIGTCTNVAPLSVMVSFLHLPIFDNLYQRP